MNGARSYLFVPGDSPRKLEKSTSSGADILILDLEDAVASERKAEARGMVRDALKTEGGPRRVVRINALTTGLAEDDIAAVMPGRPKAIILPKYETPGDLDLVCALLGENERRLGFEVGSTGIIALVCETAAGLLSLAANPPSHSRLKALMWGAEDLAQDVGALANRDETGGYSEPFRLARTLCLMAAAAAKIDAIDAVFVRIDDAEGLGGECRAARRDGFSSKAAIHPGQIGPINDAFTPSEAERAWALKVIAAFDAAPNSGALRLDGEMIDQPHLKRARRILGAGQ